MKPVDQPKMLGAESDLKLRLEQVNDPHVAPLTEFVQTLRAKMGPEAVIPLFDPWDGGVEAEVLFLLEAPGPKAKSSGFISMNNPDETAKNFFELIRETGIDRNRIVVWNAVPWYIGSDVRIRPANQTDLSLGSESIEDLLRLLPKLRAVVLVGRKSQKIKERIKGISSKLAIFSSPHPSPLFVNRAPQNRNILLREWRSVKMFLDG